MIISENNDLILCFNKLSVPFRRMTKLEQCSAESDVEGGICKHGHGGKKYLLYLLWRGVFTSAKEVQLECDGGAVTNGATQCLDR